MWVSSVSIVWYHVVTISIIGAMRLTWPPSVKFLTASFSLSFFGIEFMNPACITRYFGPNGFQIFVIIRLGVFFALLFFPSVMSAIVMLCTPARHPHEDGRPRPLPKLRCCQMPRAPRPRR